MKIFFKIFISLLLIVCFNNYAQDNLVKEIDHSDNWLIQQYQNELKNILFKNTFGGQTLRVIIYSYPEKAISIEKQTDGRYLLVSRTLSEALWTYEIKEIETLPIPIPEEHQSKPIETKLAFDKKYLEEQKKKIHVVTHKTFIEEDIYYDLQSICDYFIFNAITMQKNYGGMDGRTYLFQTFSNDKILTAEIWSPGQGSRTWDLVKLCESLIDFVNTDSANKEQILLGIKSQIKNIITICNITPNPRLSPTAFTKTGVVVIISVILLFSGLIVVRLFKKQIFNKKLR